MTQIPIPIDVQTLIRRIFGDCNTRVSEKLSRIPNVHETSLDHTFVEHFTHHCRPMKSPSDWLVRFDCHFIGGGRHFGRWEVADFGILVVYRRRSQVIRSKVALLQSKRLYPKETDAPETAPIDNPLGLNDLFLEDDRWAELSAPRTFSFTDTSRYHQLQVADEQYEAITNFEKRANLRRPSSVTAVSAS